MNVVLSKLSNLIPWWAAVGCIVSVIVSIFVWYKVSQNSSWYEIRWQVALLMCCVTLPVSLFDISQHIRHMHNPPLQILVVRILWMVPFYSINSFLALRFTKVSFYITTVREMYEAFVLYSFVLFCFRFVALRHEEQYPNATTYASLQSSKPEPTLSEPFLATPKLSISIPDPNFSPNTNDDDDLNSSSITANSSNATAVLLNPNHPLSTSPSTNSTSSANKTPHRGSLSHHNFSDVTMIKTVKRVLNTKQPLKHHFPLCCMRPWYMIGDCEFYTVCRRGVAQYVVWRITASLLALGLESADAYGEGEFVFSKGYLYITIIFNMSQCWALYCLVMVYEALEQELRPMKPLAKFVCVKSVVFFSWWQAFFLSGLVLFGAIPTKDASGRDVASDTQAFLICVEMFLISMVHHYVFPWHAPYLWVGLSDLSVLARLSNTSSAAAAAYLSSRHPLLIGTASSPFGPEGERVPLTHGLKAVLSVSDIAQDAKDLRADYKHTLMAGGRSTNETLKTLKHAVTKSGPHTPDANRKGAVM
eukprot:c7377_g1_i2.p1 GENE.c7377_g1_i2~~c7377_g1_i2.p1  ORF type:complete len:545 (-),score=134.35 c7377_g1_i2:206-1801(-)